MSINSETKPKPRERARNGDDRTHTKKNHAKMFFCVCDRTQQINKHSPESENEHRGGGGGGGRGRDRDRKRERKKECVRGRETARKRVCVRESESGRESDTAPHWLNTTIHEPSVID